MAGYFASKGYEVSLYAREPERVAMFLTNRLIVSGAINGTYPLSLISCDMEEVIRDAHLIMITTPAQYHSIVAMDMAPYLKDGQVVLLNPGRTFGTCEFDTVLKQNHCSAAYILGEAETFAFTCRCNQVGFPIIYKIKDHVLVAAHKKEYGKSLISVLQKALPCFQLAESIFYTGLANIGMIFHPIPFIMNITRIEQGESFLHYREGITPLVSQYLENLDSERLAVARALGIQILSAKDWLFEKYHANGNNLYEAIQATEAYAEVVAPSNIYSRYVFEDIPTGLVPLYSIAQELSVSTPIAKATIDWASAIYGVDFMAQGRNAAKLQLSFMLNR